MQTAQITVKFRNVSKKSEKTGNFGPASVKDEHGKYWKFWTRKIPFETFEEGRSYTIGYKTERNRSGDDEYFIEEVLPDNVTALPTAAPRPAVNGNGHSNGNVSPDRERAIYEQALLKCFIDAGKVELHADAITAAIIAIQTAYDRTR